MTFRFKDHEGNEEINRIKLFNKLMDFYDPADNEYLISYFVFNELYKLRDKVAQIIDIHVKMVCSDNVLMNLARRRPNC